MSKTACSKLTSLMPASEFTTAVDALPLVSIHLCIFCDSLLLLGKRNNRPAKELFFSPGGRIRKNERWDSAFNRISKDEVGLVGGSLPEKTLMGVWDHFYTNSAFSEHVSTHYVNLPYPCEIQPKLKKKLLLPKGKVQQHCC